MFLQLGQSTVHIGRQPNGFTESFYTEWDDGLGTDRISIFMVLHVESTQVPSAEIAKEAFQLLKDHFLHDLSGDPYDRFESSLREINEMVEEQQKKLELKFVPNMHVVLGVTQGDKLYLSQRGRAHGYLIRKRHLSLVTDDLFDPKNTDDVFQNIASGSLEPGDSLVFSTDSLVSYVTPNDLAHLFSEHSAEKANQKLSEMLNADLDEVLTVLSVEVLERVEESEVLARTEQVSVVEEKPAQSSVRERSVASLNVHRERMDRALNQLRSYVARSGAWDRFHALTGNRFEDRRSFLLGAAVAAFLLVGGVSYLVYSTSQQKQLDSAQEKLATAESYVEQATTRGTFDKSEASDLLEQAETLALEVLDSGRLGGQSSALLDDIREKRDSLDNIVNVSSSLTDLTSLTSIPEMVKDVIAYQDAHLLIGEHSVYPVLIDKIQSPVLVDATRTIVSATYFADADAVVMQLSDGQIVEYKDGHVQLADTSDSAWKTGIALATYSNKLYVLDAANGQIWRYQRSSAGYSGAQSYVDPEKVDLKTAVNFTIDGKVWTLNEEGQLDQLLSGAPVDFKILKAPLSPVKGSSKMITDLETPVLYVMNPDEKRLYVFDKSSKNSDVTYRLQYDLSSLKGELKGFYVDKTRKVIIIATSVELYEVSAEQ